MPVSIDSPRSAIATLVERAGGALAGSALGAVAAVRGGKPVHPDGVVHEAEVVIDGGPSAPPGSSLLGAPRTHRAIVRFSRSIGAPRPLPDLLGMSIRVLDAYGPGRPQDLLLVTGVDRPGLHAVLLPASDVQQRPYTSALPYSAGGRSFILGALPRADSPRPAAGDEFERLAAAAATGNLVFDLAASARLGRFRRLGELRIGRRLPDELDALRFNVANCGGGLAPAGLLNGMRPVVYRITQEIWGRAGGGEAQRAADRILAARAGPGSIERGSRTTIRSGA